MKTLFQTTDSNKVLTADNETPNTLHAKVEAQLHAGVAHFFFTKKDGSNREAYGTLNKELLEKILGPQEEKEMDGQDNSTKTTQIYYDLDAKAFRSYTISSLVALF